jgi:hypothetical protein
MRLADDAVLVVALGTSVAAVREVLEVPLEPVAA